MNDFTELSQLNDEDRDRESLNDPFIFEKKLHKKMVKVIKDFDRLLKLGETDERK